MMFLCVVEVLRAIMIFDNNSACLYTAIFGDYEKLNELEGDAKKSKIRKICFTDDNELTSETWEIRVVKPVFPLDSVRSQRMVKVNPHHFLSDFKSSFYIDNTVRLLVDPALLIEEFCSYGNITLPIHSYRESVYEEFFEVAQAGLDDSARVFEQLNHYQIICPESLHRKPYWAGMILRNHMESDVIEIMEEWYRQILRYSRRDQLSLVYSEMMTGNNIRKLVIDSHESSFHQWPVTNSRDFSKRSWSSSLSGAMPIFEKIKTAKAAERDVEEKIRRLAKMGEEIADTYKPSMTPEGFDPELYLALNKDVAAAGADAVKHYLRHGWREGRRWH
ncbi:glycosyltransferase domain-containing protein [Pantoea sp. At-9b]|uniref:glycosyltransferase domain-containing protein n=1 Tax=Pantoea sp. (strain At-9b) TaxID=592316 RepID=UPI0002E70196|nr:glycosyltransferase domain-containing protein [Pantoea sp. At-9b]